MSWNARFLAFCVLSTCFNAMDSEIHIPLPNAPAGNPGLPQ